MSHTAIPAAGCIGIPDLADTVVKFLSETMKSILTVDSARADLRYASKISLEA